MKGQEVAFTIMIHLEDEDGGPVEDEDGDHHHQHRNDGLHMGRGPVRAETEARLQKIYI